MNFLQFILEFSVVLVLSIVLNSFLFFIIKLGILGSNLKISLDLLLNNKINDINILLYDFNFNYIFNDNLNNYYSY